MTLGRIQILDNPVAPPAKCIVCGAATGDDKRKFIDFGFTEEWYGVIYFCSLCLTEIFTELNFVEYSTYKTLLEQNQELKRALDDANVRIESLSDTLRNCFNDDSAGDTLRDVFDSSPVSHSHPVSDSVAEQFASDDNASSDIEKSGDVRSTSESNSSDRTPAKSSPLGF